MFSITLQLGKLFRAALHSEVQFKLFPGSLETWLLVRAAPHGQQRQAICSGWNHPPSKAIPSSDPAGAMGQCWEHSLTGVPGMRNAGCVSRPRAGGVRKMLVPQSTLNASLQAVGVGSIWEAFSSKRRVHPL